MITVARALHTPLHISHLKAMGMRNWGKRIPHAQALMARARQESMDVSCDVYPYTAGSTQLLHILPPDFLEGGTEAIAARLRKQENRELLRERIRSIAAEHGMTLNDAQTQQLADLFRKIQSLGGSNFAERMQDLPGTVEKIRESGESALSTAGTVWASIRGFFQRVGKTLSAIFGG